MKLSQIRVYKLRAIAGQQTNPVSKQFLLELADEMQQDLDRAVALLPGMS